MGGQDIIDNSAESSYGICINAKLGKFDNGKGTEEERCDNKTLHFNVFKQLFFVTLPNRIMQAEVQGTQNEDNNRDDLIRKTVIIHYILCVRGKTAGAPGSFKDEEAMEKGGLRCETNIYTTQP